MPRISEVEKRARHELLVARLVVGVPVLLMLVGYVTNVVMAATHQL